MTWDVDNSQNRRVVFYPPYDLAFGSQYGRAVDVLSQEPLACNCIVDALELYQCYLLVQSDARLESINDATYDSLVRKSAKAKGLALGFVGKCADDSTLEDILLQAEGVCEYGKRIWQLLGACKAYKKITSASIAHALEDNGSRIRYACSYPWPSVHFPEAVRDALRANAHIAAILLVDKYSAYNRSEREICLPEVLTDEDVNYILVEYLNADNPNPNYVNCIVSWPSDCKVNLSKETLILADKIKRSQDKELYEVGYSVDYGVEICFDPNQRECVMLRLDRGHVSYSYSTKWLCKTLDYPSILNNFVHIFGLVDGYGLINMRSTGRNRSVFMSLLMRPKAEYALDEYAQLTMRHAQAVLMMYSMFLREHGVSIEGALEWFYNEYINETFGIHGFSISVPSDGTSFYEKCSLVAQMTERVVKQFSILAKYGVVDPDYYRYETFGGFENVPSLIPNKYAKGCGKDYDKESFLLFSDQSLLHVALHCNEGDCFAEQVARGNVKRNDFPAYAHEALVYLIDRRCIGTDDDGTLWVSSKVPVLKRLWDSISFPTFRFFDGQQSVYQAVLQEGEVTTYRSLFSNEEAEYLNYMFNRRGHSASLGLRDKYAHGGGYTLDLNGSEAQSDYWSLLSVLVCVTLKINEELCLYTGVDLETELVDCEYFRIDDSSDRIVELAEP